MSGLPWAEGPGVASDRPVRPEDIVPCPDDCTRLVMHRHLRDGTTQIAHRGMGITDTGEVIHGPQMEKP